LTREWREERGEPLEPWKTVKTKEAGKIQLGRQRSPKYHRGPTMRPYLRVQNVFEDRIDLDDVMEMDFSGADLEKYTLHPCDILLNEGQSPQYLGRPAMYRGELPGACFTNSLIRFQAGTSVVPDFALLVFRHCMHSGRYVSEGTITTNIAHLSAGRFGEVEFPLPSHDEQTEIVRRAQQLFTLADQLDARLTAARKIVDRLTPALLAKAFRGELVPQDPSEEPASVLMERIRAARQA
jgi:type I restriction enzyme S subunit